MQILLLNTYYGTRQWNGRRVHIMQFAKHLRALGHQVYSFSGSADDGISPLPAGVAARYRLLRQMDAFYMRVEGIPPAWPRFLRPPYRWGLRTVPLVWEIEDTPELQASTQPAAVGATRFRNFRRLASGVQLAICPTASLARYAADLGIPRRAVVPNGSDPDIFRPDDGGPCEVPANPDGLNVIWVGNPERPTWHDFDSMCLAARALVTDPRFRFFVVAPGPPLADLPPNMEQVRQRPYPELPALLGRMDVGLCLYRKEEWTRYGAPTSPLKLFDYMACGLIVVGSPIDQVEECLSRRGAGFVVPFEDVDALVRTLQHIMEKKAQLETRRRIARTLVVDYYNWRRAAVETVDAIRAARVP